MGDKGSETPLMRQYNQIKAKHPDALLLFRVGDFYETFGQDAIKASRILGIVLTKRSNGAAAEMELAGFPHHSLDTYLPKLVRAGQRVAICDQLEDPKTTKKIVKRGVTELVTPGVTFNDQILRSDRNNFLCAIYPGKTFGVAFLDVSTGEFLVAQGGEEYVGKLLQSLRPTEIIYAKQAQKRIPSRMIAERYTYGLDDWVFAYDYGFDLLTHHFGTTSLKGFGVQDLEDATVAAGAVFHYLRETQNDKLGHITALSRIAEENHIWMDQFTLRNLEIFHSNAPDGRSLFDVIDQTHSPMGARMLQRWLALPLKSRSAIEDRLEVVEIFRSKTNLQEKVVEILSSVYDLERLVSKVSTGKVHPRELLQLKASLEACAQIKERIGKVNSELLSRYADQIHPMEGLRKRILETLSDDPPALVSKGDVIREGVDEELDQYRDLIRNGKTRLQEVLQKETDRTGIPSLKLAFNNVFGYYLEVRNTHKNKVPDDWIRKQTLVNAERYITDELKVLEARILEAEEKIMVREQYLYERLVEETREYLHQIQSNAQVLARIDCLVGFALLARKNKYARPIISDDRGLEIKQGRHPVIEQQLPPGEAYVANDVLLDPETQQIIMITGPNMSGKSALLRQTALITILAQMGSFVPAREAKIGMVDKLFVRVGASDNISQGESTFMVEMNETASILNNLSDRSLILLDEIGRGTSTYDGISIAWAIAEYLHEHPTRPKTLFATHYHELNEMTHTFDRIRNFNVSVKEMDKDVIFLRKLVPGGSEHSFGIHVARMAGMPAFVLNRAEQLLERLEDSRDQEASKDALKDEMQLSFFQLDDPLLDEVRHQIQTLDINALTPVEALMILIGLKKKLGG